MDPGRDDHECFQEQLMPTSTHATSSNVFSDSVTVANEDQHYMVIRLENSNHLFRMIDTGEVVWEPAESASTATYGPRDLIEAMLDLHSVRRMAEEDDDVVPSDDTVERAKKVLEGLYRAFPRPYSVYPMMEGDIAVEAHTKPGTDVTVICDSDGSYRCLMYIDDEFRRIRFCELGEMFSPAVIDAFIRTSPDSYIQSLW